MIRLFPFTMLVGFALLAACSNEDAPVNKSAIMPMLGAVMHSETDEVRRLNAIPLTKPRR
jgi:hypothetical protein